ncbi:hypothetical protein BDW71DRAFT_28215 [Aspergillus fruticulosus]
MGVCDLVLPCNLDNQSESAPINQTRRFISAQASGGDRQFESALITRRREFFVLSCRPITGSSVEGTQPLVWNCETRLANRSRLVYADVPPAAWSAGGAEAEGEGVCRCLILASTIVDAVRTQLSTGKLRSSRADTEGLGTTQLSCRSSAAIPAAHPASR